LRAEKRQETYGACSKTIFAANRVKLLKFTWGHILLDVPPVEVNETQEMFCAFLVYAVEDYSKIPKIEEFLRGTFLGVVSTTASPAETKATLEDLEKGSGFIAWKEIPEEAFNLAVTQILLNVNPYHIRWEITYAALKEKFAIGWVWYAIAKPLPA